MEFTVPPSWTAAVARIEQGLARRVVVIGGTDAGKTSFVQAALRAAAASGAPLSLVDLDPGQKMIGPPGTAGLRSEGGRERLVFVGSTSASELSRIAAAAAFLADGASGPFIANTAGFVRGLGARVQSATIAALKADLIVAIGDREALRTIIDAHPNLAVAWLERSELARRKSPSERARLRQAAFLAALAGAEPVRFPAGAVSFAPSPPAPFSATARPVCALTTAEGEVASIGILHQAGEEVAVFTRPLRSTARLTIQLGKIWAARTQTCWELLEQLSPAWEQPGLPDPPRPGRS